jgi:hypothetical protein
MTAWPLTRRRSERIHAQMRITQAIEAMAQALPAASPCTLPSPVQPGRKVVGLVPHLASHGNFPFLLNKTSPVRQPGMLVRDRVHNKARETCTPACMKVTLPVSSGGQKPGLDVGLFDPSGNVPSSGTPRRST